MNIFYVFDEYTDIADGNGAEKVRDIIMDAFKNPHKERPAGELMLGAMAREYVADHRISSAGANLLSQLLDPCFVLRSPWRTLLEALHPRLRHLHCCGCQGGRRSL